MRLLVAAVTAALALTATPAVAATPDPEAATATQARAGVPKLVVTRKVRGLDKPWDVRPIGGGRLIACGSVAEIRAVVARKQISCSSALTADEIRSWPDVVAVTPGPRRLQITVVDAEAVVRRLLAADDQVRDLEIRQAGLAEAFTELTKEAA